MREKNRKKGFKKGKWKVRKETDKEKKINRAKDIEKKIDYKKYELNNKKKHKEKKTIRE